jgi:hypothetical protein
LLTHRHSLDRQLFKLYNPNYPINILMKQFYKILKINRTIILPVVWYGYETWSLTLKEHGSRVFENRMVRRISGPKRDEVTREWRKLHNEELTDLYSLLSIVRVIKLRRMRWV